MKVIVLLLIMLNTYSAMAVEEYKTDSENIRIMMGHTEFKECREFSIGETLRYTLNKVKAYEQVDVNTKYKSTVFITGFENQGLENERMIIIAANFDHGVIVGGPFIYVDTEISVTYVQSLCNGTYMEYVFQSRMLRDEIIRQESEIDNILKLKALVRKMISKKIIKSGDAKYAVLLVAINNLTNPGMISKDLYELITYHVFEQGKFKGKPSVEYKRLYTIYNNDERFAKVQQELFELTSSIEIISKL